MIFRSWKIPSNLGSLSWKPGSLKPWIAGGLVSLASRGGQSAVSCVCQGKGLGLEKKIGFSLFEHNGDEGGGEGVRLGQMPPSFLYLSPVGWPLSTPTSRDSSSFWRRVTILVGAPGAAVVATTVTSCSPSGQCSAR